MNTTQAQSIAGSLGFPSKMPGSSYGIPATACLIGSKLAAITGTVCSGCYAMNGNYRYESVAKSQATRLASLTNPLWTDAMVTMLRKAHGLDGHRVHRKVTDPGWHRWHDSGDIQSVTHLAAICEVARRTPEIRHWLPTREIGILMAYRKQGGIVPGNLCIRVSATKIDGAPTKLWPTTSTVHEHGEPVGHRCVAPDHDGKCGPCRACWSNEVPNTSYHKHA